MYCQEKNKGRQMVASSLLTYRIASEVSQQREENSMKLKIMLAYFMVFFLFTASTVFGQGPVTEGEVLTSEVMKLLSSGDYTQGVKVAKHALQVAQ
jgi:hypothetical protein